MMSGSTRSLLIGVLSVVSFVLSILLGVMIASIGMAGLFRTVVLPLSLVGAIIGFIDRKKADDRASYRLASIGFWLNVIVISAIIGTHLILIVLFVPILFSHS